MKKIINIFWGLVLIFCGLSMSHADSQCQIDVQQPLIDYGRLTQGNISRGALGSGTLPQKNQFIMVICAEEQELNLKIDSLHRNNINFSYGNESVLELKVNSITVNGSAYGFRVFRDNQLKSTTTIQPGDIIKPYPQVVGKTMGVTIDITPVIKGKELVSYQGNTLQEDINVSYNSERASFTILSTLFSTGCTPSVSSQSVNYGTITPSQLKNDRPTILPAKVVNFSISCGGPSYVALRAKSNRLNSAADIQGTENSIGSSIPIKAVVDAGLGKNLPLGLPDIVSPSVAGLGLNYNSQPMGGYMLNLPLTTIKLDGVPVLAKFWTQQLPSPSSYWNKSTVIGAQGGSLFSELGAYFSYSTNASSDYPSPFTTLTGSLIIQAYITAKNNLNFSQLNQLDGSASIELFYF